MKYITLMAVMCLAAIAIAQDCPVTIVKVDPQQWNVVAVSYQNNSDRPVQAVSLGSEFANSMGDIHPAYAGFIAEPFNGVLKPGKKGHFRFDDELWKYEWSTYGGTAVNVWVKRVKFKDGTTWQDNGSHLCMGQWASGQKRNGSWWTR